MELKSGTTMTVKAVQATFTLERTPMCCCNCQPRHSLVSDEHRRQSHKQPVALPTPGSSVHITPTALSPPTCLISQKSLSIVHATGVEPRIASVPANQPTRQNRLDHTHTHSATHTIAQETNKQCMSRAICLVEPLLLCHTGLVRGLFDPVGWVVVRTPVVV